MAVFICQGCGTEYPSWGGRCASCGNTESIRLNQQADAMVDRVIKGKYKILRKLGQGGMGAVYLAEQVGIGHRVALKFLKSEFSTDPEIARRFLNEAKSYARVAHPNAVTLHDFGQDEDGNLFIAMEYCEGVDLKRVIAEQGKMPLGEAVEVVMQVADVLANAHEKGVIHRDLKPENIMIRRGMRGVHAKVLDFGIARLMNEGTRLTVVGSIAGTPRYMSPEQVSGQEVDLRADIYSLGIVLFECITGHQPFDGGTVAEILKKQALEPMPALAAYGAECDFPDVDRVIQKACAKAREERWPDLIAFANALSQAMPTQANITLSSTRPGGVTGLNPAAPQAYSASGVAVPGSGSGKEANAATLMRPSVDGPPMVTPVPTARANDATQQTHLGPVASSTPIIPLASMVAAAAPVVPTISGNKTQLETTPTAQLQVSDASMPPMAPKSKTPVVVVGLLVAIGIVGGIVVMTAKPPPPVEPPKVEVPKVPVAELPKVEPPKNEPPKVELEAAMRELKNNANRTTLAQGRTAFSNADLDAAETYLKSIEAESDSKSAADELLATIATIRAKLRQADGLRGAGQCPAALPLYAEVLKLNPKMIAASSGQGACKAGIVSDTMEP